MEKNEGVIQMSRSRHFTKYTVPQGSHPKFFKWYAKEPKWWRKLKKHRLRRQEARKCINLVMRLTDNGVSVMWPLDKKPWIYYW